MKKLMTISAIFTISIFATTANAEGITAGGSYWFEMQMGGADNASDAAIFSGGNYDFFVNVERITDSGLIFTGATHLNGADSGESAIWDESTGAIIADFGTISFSNDGGGVASMAPGADGVSASGNIDDYIKINGESAAGGRHAGAPDGENIISYTSPNLVGFKAGITLGRNGGNSKINASEENVTKTTDNNGVITGSYNIPDNINTEYMGVAFSYSSSGATIAYARGVAAQAIYVKGITNNVADSNDDGFDESTLNGKYGDISTITTNSIRYRAGALAVGYSNTISDVSDKFVAGDRIPKPTDAGTLAELQINERTIGVSFDYGDGIVSYVMATEDRGVFEGTGADRKGSAEDLSTTLIAVNHSIGDGLNVYLEHHSGSADIEVSEPREPTVYESVFENVIGIMLIF